MFDMKNNAGKKWVLKQRYGSELQPENIIWNDTIELLLSHRSVRTFLPETLPPGTIETIVAAAQSASTSSNLHQWSVVAITDPTLKEKIAETSRKGSKFGMGNPYIEQAPVLLLWVADMSRNNHIAKTDNGKAEIHDYTDAFLMSSIDVALAAQNAAIAAESLGVGIVYLGAMRNNAKEIADIINLPEYSYVVFGMLLGKPDSDRLSSIRPRPNQKFVLHYNGFKKDQWKDELESYEKAFMNFREENNMKKKTWKENILFSSNNIDYLDGRENLRQTLEEKGFKFK